MVDAPPQLLVKTRVASLPSFVARVQVGIALNEHTDARGIGLTNNPRTKHCRASHLAACGHTVLPKIGPVIALRRRTDYQFSPNWLSGAEDELSQSRFR